MTDRKALPEIGFGRQQESEPFRTRLPQLSESQDAAVMDGFDTARSIREPTRFERTPIVFVTGVHVTELDTLRGYAAGAIDYISVPVVPETLRSKVALLVELYRRRAELEALNRDLEATRARLEIERSHAVAASESRLREGEARYRAIFENPMMRQSGKRVHLGEIIFLQRWDAVRLMQPFSCLSCVSAAQARLSDAPVGRCRITES